VLRKRHENLSTIGHQRLKALFAKYPALQPLYDAMHRLRALLNQKHQTKRACRPLASKLLDFIDALKSSALPPLIPSLIPCRPGENPWLAMWRFTKNNGITEGFHRKMKLIQRRAYGSKTSLTTAFALSLNAANFPTKTTPSPKFGGDPVKG
jgi:transposase